MADRREFLTALLAAGALPGASELFRSDPLRAAGVDQSAPVVSVDERALDFWTTFLQREGVPASRRPAAPGRRQADDNREPFFLYYDTAAGLQPALDVPATQLQPSGDLSVSMNVAAFKPAAEDQATFERLQNAQLRIDVVQTHAIMSLLDPIAWTAVAALHPTKEGKLPPLQNLNYDPSASSPKMQSMTLPGGEGRWAFNLTAQRKDSFFSQLLRQVVPEVGKFAPFLGMPGISVVALNSFNAFYGALHDKTVSLFQGAPVPIYGTADALKNSGLTQGVPLRTGTYVLVPAEHAQKVPPDRLKGLTVKGGFVVPLGTNTNDMYQAAATALPDVTYATVEVSVKSAPASTGGRGSRR